MHLLWHERCCLSKKGKKIAEGAFQATALVHEACVHLVDVEEAQHWDCRGYFFAAAAEAMPGSC
jgi:hypothetical protein